VISPFNFEILNHSNRSHFSGTMTTTIYSTSPLHPSLSQNLPPVCIPHKTPLYVVSLTVTQL
jgi:hypothetical protein